MDSKHPPTKKNLRLIFLAIVLSILLLICIVALGTYFLLKQQEKQSNEKSFQSMYFMQEKQHILSIQSTAWDQLTTLWRDLNATSLVKKDCILGIVKRMSCEYPFAEQNSWEQRFFNAWGEYIYSSSDKKSVDVTVVAQLIDQKILTQFEADALHTLFVDRLEEITRGSEWRMFSRMAVPQASSARYTTIHELEKRLITLHELRDQKSISETDFLTTIESIADLSYKAVFLENVGWVELYPLGTGDASTTTPEQLLDNLRASIKDAKGEKLKSLQETLRRLEDVISQKERIQQLVLTLEYGSL